MLFALIALLGITAVTLLGCLIAGTLPPINEISLLPSKVLYRINEYQVPPPDT